MEHGGARPVPPPLPARRRDPDLIPDRSRIWSDEDEEEPMSYGVHAPEVVPVESTPQELVQPKESEMRLLSRDDVPKQPTAAWGPELLAFLASPVHSRLWSSRRGSASSSA